MVPAVSNSGSVGNVLFKMIRFAKNLLSAGLKGLALGLLVLPATAATPVTKPVNLPLYFEANEGQADGPAQFIARGHDYQFLISPAEARIVLRQTGAKPAAVQMQFAGANPQAQIHGDTELAGKINYLNGSNPAQWRTGVPMFAGVRVEQLYPGVGLVYYGNQKRLEYDFTVAPGAKAEDIALHFDGVEKISIDAQDELVLTLASGEIRQPRPMIYQVLNGARKEIKGGYRLVDDRTAAFVLGEYDHSQTLVIDPLLEYSSFFGGNGADSAYAVTLDTNGNVYIAGQTLSKEFSATRSFSTTGAFQTNFAGGNIVGDGVIFKMSATGTPAYITYLGGSGDDTVYSLAVDSAGHVYVAGATDSPDFPVTNAIPGHANIQGKVGNLNTFPTDAFVAELDASGSNLIYSTYLGGESSEAAYDIAVDSTDNAYITGFTYSTNFPTTANAMQPHLVCTNSFSFNANAFVTEIASNGQSLVFSTYFGGNNFDYGKGIAVDTNGFVYVTGFTGSTNFPNTNAFQQGLNQSTNLASRNFDGFVAKFNPAGAGLVYSTYLGSTNNDVANGIAVDGTGAAYVTGWTTSSNFPNTFGMTVPGLTSFLATNTSLNFLVTNVFLTKITNGPQAGIAWSTVFGGKGVDVGNAVALDPAGDVFVTGSASSTDFPTFNVPTQMRYTNSGQSDAFVTVFSASATNLLYSTYLGGKKNDYGYGIAVNTNGDAYVVGQTLSPNFLFNNDNIPSLNYPTLNGPSDAFLTKITLTVRPAEIVNEDTNVSVSVGSSVQLFVSGPGNGTPPFHFQWQYNGMDLADGGNISGATNSNLLNINNAQTTNSGLYALIVTNYGGSVTSSYTILTVTNIPPAISTNNQPISQTNGVGTTATFSVFATGTAPLSYHWQLEGTNLVNGGHYSGVTNSVLKISTIQLTNAGNYSVVVTNAGGSTTSSNALLTVLSAPIITVEPATNQSMAVGATAAFSVTAIGAVPLKYQWWDGTNALKNGSVKNGPTISGATTNLLIISNVQTTNSSTNYSVTVTNNFGSVTSTVAALEVTNIPPAITTQPISQTNGVGSSVTFIVFGTGSLPIHFQWQKDGVNLVNGLTNGATIGGATTNKLTISKVQLTNAGNYTLIVTNFGGSVTSSVAVLKVESVPVIVVQPATNQSMAVGSTAAFAVTAIGTVPLKYQWWDGTNALKNGSVKNGPTISGATTNVLTITDVQTTNTGNYTVVITNLAGSVTSSVAALTVTNIPPAITVQPITNLSIAVGSNLTLTVTATGTAPLGYNWQLNGTNLVNGGSISGATTNVLKITSAQTTNSGTYTVIVTNLAGSVTSSNAVVTVTNVPPTITLQPTNQTVSMGTLASLVINATGPGPLSYQWQVGGTNLLNGGNITGATTNILKFSNVQTNNSSTNYSVIVTNLGGSVTSSIVSLTVLGVPVITLQPATNQSMAVGSTAIFAVTAIGMVPLSYHWQLNGTNLLNGGSISGVTTTNLIISNTQTNNSGNYTAVVTNLAGSVTSLVASLTVTNILPAITVQPASQTNGVGSTAIFSVTATGTAPLHYQWLLGGTNLANGGHFSGVTTNVLAISTVQLTNAGDYSVIITNYGGSVTSSVATLTVQAAPIIVVQPATNQSMAVSSTAAFAVSAIGTVPLSYQWWNGTNQVKDGSIKNGATISGATTSLLFIFNAQTTNSSTNYTVTITNISGAVTSSVASLTVTNIPPAITLQPTNQAWPAGSNVFLVVTATGTAPLAYQWRLNGTNRLNGGNISGATTNVLKITKAQTTNTGNYDVVVTNYGGSITSSVASLTVASTPVILMLQPTNQAVGVGSTPSFTVTAVGTLPLSYQWQVNGTNLTNGFYNGSYSIGGATTNVLTIGNAQTNNTSLNYTVIVTNTSGSVTSSFLSLTVTNIPPTILTNGQPVSQTNSVGSTITLVVSATGTPPFTYQWQVNQTNLVDGTNLVDEDVINGATNSVLTISNAQTNNSSTNYTVIVTGPGGSVTSSNATVLVTNIPPSIILQPTNQTAASGSTVTLAVVATGTAPLGYQWQAVQAGVTNFLVDGGQISGSTNATLVISNVQLANSGSYLVTVSNPAGSVLSSNAVLTVLAAPVDFGGIDSSGFKLSGTGGSSNATYYVLVSTNLQAPLTNWTSIGTDQFDSAGNFIFTNTAQTNEPQLFYILQLP